MRRIVVVSSGLAGAKVAARVKRLNTDIDVNLIVPGGEARVNGNGTLATLTKGRDLSNTLLANYELAGQRALAVLEQFVANGLPQKRFSVAGYGPHWAIADNATEDGRAQNRRVEILLKTTPWLGAYVR